MLDVSSARTSPYAPGVDRTSSSDDTSDAPRRGGEPFRRRGTRGRALRGAARRDRDDVPAEPPAAGARRPRRRARHPCVAGDGVELARRGPPLRRRARPGNAGAAREPGRAGRAVPGADPRQRARRRRSAGRAGGRPARRGADGPARGGAGALPAARRRSPRRGPLRGRRPVAPDDRAGGRDLRRAAARAAGRPGAAGDRSGGHRRRVARRGARPAGRRRAGHRPLSRHPAPDRGQRRPPAGPPRPHLPRAHLDLSRVRRAGQRPGGGAGGARDRQGRRRARGARERPGDAGRLPRADEARGRVRAVRPGLAAGAHPRGAGGPGARADRVRRRRGAAGAVPRARVAGRDRAPEAARGAAERRAARGRPGLRHLHLRHHRHAQVRAQRARRADQPVPVHDALFRRARRRGGAAEQQAHLRLVGLAAVLAADLRRPHGDPGAGRVPQPRPHDRHDRRAPHHDDRLRAQHLQRDGLDRRARRGGAGQADLAAAADRGRRGDEPADGRTSWGPCCPA